MSLPESKLAEILALRSTLITEFDDSVAIGEGKAEAKLNMMAALCSFVSNYHNPYIRVLSTTPNLTKALTSLELIKSNLESFETRRLTEIATALPEFARELESMLDDSLPDELNPLTKEEYDALVSLFTLCKSMAQGIRHTTIECHINTINQKLDRIDPEKHDFIMEYKTKNQTAIEEILASISDIKRHRLEISRLGSPVFRPIPDPVHPPLSPADDDKPKLG